MSHRAAGGFESAHVALVEPRDARNGGCAELVRLELDGSKGAGGAWFSFQRRVFVRDAALGEWTPLTSEDKLELYNYRAAAGAFGPRLRKETKSLVGCPYRRLSKRGRRPRGRRAAGARVLSWPTRVRWRGRESRDGASLRGTRSVRLRGALERLWRNCCRQERRCKFGPNVFEIPDPTFWELFEEHYLARPSTSNIQVAMCISVGVGDWLRECRALDFFESLLEKAADRVPRVKVATLKSPKIGCLKRPLVLWRERNAHRYCGWG